jgi:UPF0755 protein
VTLRRSWRLLAVSCALLAGCGQAPSGPVERLLVPAGASLSTVADSLEAHGLLRSRLWFRVVAWAGRFERAIKPGLYEFVPGTSALAILRDLRDARYVTVRLTIPEGLTLRQIAETVAARFPIPAESVLAAARDTTLLRRGGVDGATAEGYLEPDTYLVPAHWTARDMVGLMLDEAQTTWDSAFAARLAEAKWTRHEVLTLASIVEGEAQVDEERPVIAAVYLNRLRIRMPLQADPTVQYALELATGSRKTRLLNKDYRFPSPYNTYLHPGLPPGPVGAPGVKSIEAVLDPAEVSYRYFVATGGGRHAFSITYNEHLRAIARRRR